MPFKIVRNDITRAGGLGSYAYQCTKEQLEKLMEQTGCEIDKMNELTSEKIYGIVFVEEV